MVVLGRSNSCLRATSIFSQQVKRGKSVAESCHHLLNLESKRKPNGDHH